MNIVTMLSLLQFCPLSLVRWKYFFQTVSCEFQRRFQKWINSYSTCKVQLSWVIRLRTWDLISSTRLMLSITEVSEDWNPGAFSWQIENVTKTILRMFHSVINDKDLISFIQFGQLWRALITDDQYYSDLLPTL